MNRNPKYKFIHTHTLPPTLWEKQHQEMKTIVDNKFETLKATHANVRFLNQRWDTTVPLALDSSQGMKAVCYGLQQDCEAVVSTDTKNWNFPAFLVGFPIHSPDWDRPGSVYECHWGFWRSSLSAHNIRVVCGVGQLRIVAVIQKAVSPAAVADEKQRRQEH